MSQPSRGIVAAGHTQTAEAAADILRAGGNAFDAAVAGVLAACVAESVLTSAAGGGFLLAHTHRGENTLFDFFSQTPQRRLPGSALDFYPIEANFGDTVQEFHIGLGSMAVPGCVAGLVTVQRRLGRLPFKEVLAPAIHLARQGVSVNPFFAYVYQLLRPILTATPESRAIYAPQGNLLKVGETLRMPNFANTLEYLAAAGPNDFYRGAIAAQLTQDCAERGGYLTSADLQQYQVIERQPLSICYRDSTLLTNPPPSSGGALIAFSLALLGECNLAELSHSEAAHLCCLSQAMQLTNQARRDGYDTQLYDAGVAEQFLSPTHVQAYRQQLAGKLGSTTHISVIDAEGNAASATTSNGEGSSYVIPGTDIMVNNMLGEEDLNPHGFHQWQPNQRISSMMAPTMILHDGRPQLVLGSGGSNRIRTAILQVVSNLIDFQMPPELAVSTPRIHWENGVLHLEPGFDRAAIEAQTLSERYVWWQAQSMFFGGVHAVSNAADGSFRGAGDSRRYGAVAVA
ncbi:MAG: gamma-glutamyltransferase [Leptolyngbya sp. SIO4C1]|nr:gamma-glutamyltransferase [Leptolyngbya sp. SIO4C1]